MKSATYSYISPADIVKRSIYKGFSRENSMIKAAGYKLHVPSPKDHVMNLNSVVNGSNFIQHLLDVRKALGDPDHQFLAYNLFEDGMTVTSYKQTSKIPVMLFDVSSGEGITAAFIPMPEVSTE